MKNRLRRKALCLLAACSLFTVGSCTLDSWKLAVGPIFAGDTAYAGVELDFSNGIDFVVPLVSLGNNW